METWGEKYRKWVHRDWETISEETWFPLRPGRAAVLSAIMMTHCVA